MAKPKKPIDPTAQPIFCPNCRSRNTFQHSDKGDRYLVDEQGNRKVGWKGYVCGSCGYDTLTLVSTAHNQNLGEEKHT